MGKLILAGILLISQLGSIGSGAVLTWDSDGASGGATGGSGNWDTSTALWDNAGSMQIWNNGTNDLASFGGTAGTVTVQTNVTASGLHFLTDGYSVVKGTATGLTLTGPGTLQADAGVTATIITPIQGSVGFEKTGAGTVVLSRQQGLRAPLRCK